MNNLLALAISMLSSFNLYANPYQEYDLPPGVKVQYDSWCEGDRIFTQDSDGESFPKWDCSEFGRRFQCVEDSEQDGIWTVVTATCKDLP